MAASFQVPPPEPFNFNRPEGWTKWFRRFERFRVASGLAEKADEMQVNTLIYSMGDEADDILRSFALSDDDRKKYQPVTAKFEAHFIKKRNVIYERARFNLRRQDEGEPVDSFITALYSLAKHCAYGNLHDEMIRDRIVVGIRNTALSEKLQLDPALTLEKAVIAVRQAEAVKEQQPLLRAIQKSRAGSRNSGATHPGSCTRCGRVPAHEHKLCPARDAICRKCQKRGHFQAMCRSAAKLHRVMDLEDGPSSDNAFMGTVGDLSSHNPWAVTLELHGNSIEFCIDTGAEVTVVSKQTYEQIGCPPLLSPDRTLRGPDNHDLPVTGQFRATLRRGSRQTQEKVYVVETLNKPLLGRPAIEGLGLLARIAALDQHSTSIIQQFPLLFAGLGKLDGEYKIRLVEGAKPFASILLGGLQYLF